MSDDVPMTPTGPRLEEAWISIDVETNGTPERSGKDNDGPWIEWRDILFAIGFEGRQIVENDNGTFTHEPFFSRGRICVHMPEGMYVNAPWWTTLAPEEQQAALAQMQREMIPRVDGAQQFYDVLQRMVSIQSKARVMADTNTFDGKHADKFLAEAGHLKGTACPSGDASYNFKSPMCCTDRVRGVLAALRAENRLPPMRLLPDCPPKPDFWDRLAGRFGRRILAGAPGHTHMPDDDATRNSICYANFMCLLLNGELIS